MNQAGKHMDPPDYYRLSPTYYLLDANYDILPLILDNFAFHQYF